MNHNGISNEDDRTLKIEDPQIVRLAKLVLLLNGTKADKITKFNELKACINDGVISQDDALMLLLGLADPNGSEQSLI